MANLVFMGKTGLIGGEATKLDSIDGATLTDNDAAFVNVSNVQYIYRLDADSGAAESSPSVISPATNAGTKRWILQGLNGASLNMPGLSASLPVFTDGSKNLVSNTMTGTGKVVMDTSPTLVTPTLGTASGTSLTLSGLTASLPVFTDGSKKLVSNTMTGTGSVVMNTSPTISTPTISGHPVVEGVTPTGATGTGNLVFATSPTLVTPALGAASATTVDIAHTPSTSSYGLSAVASSSLASNKIAIIGVTGGSNGFTVTQDADQTMVYTFTGGATTGVSGGIVNMSGTVNLNALTASLPVFTDGSKNLVSKSIADTLTALGVGAWTDYKASSTITGWSATSGHIYYLRVATKLAFVYFSLAGTSNSTSTSFTLPFALSGGPSPTIPLAYCLDNSSNTADCSCMISVSTLMAVKPGGGSWTSSGTKRIAGLFFYPIA